MSNPIVHFEIIGQDGAATQRFYGDLFGWAINADNEYRYGLTDPGKGMMDHGIAGGSRAAPTAAARARRSTSRSTTSRRRWPAPRSSAAGRSSAPRRSWTASRSPSSPTRTATSSGCSRRGAADAIRRRRARRRRASRGAGAGRRAACRRPWRAARLAVEEVAAARAVAAAVGAGRRVAAALGDERVLHVGERLDLADRRRRRRRSAPAPPEPRRTAYSHDAQRELQLQRLDRRVQGVGHRDVHGARAGRRPGRRPGRRRASRSRRSRRCRASGCSWCPGRRRGRRPSARGRRRARRSRRCRPRPPRAPRRRAACPGSVITSTGRCAPALGGMSASVSTRTANRHALRVTATGQLRLPGSCAGAAGEVEDQPVAVDGRGDAQLQVAVDALQDVGRRVASRRAGRRGTRACGARRSRGPTANASRSPSAPRRSRQLARRAARRAGWPRAARAGRRGARRAGASAPTSSSIASSSRTRGAMTTPSSSSVRESNGIDPGTRPPTSAWCAREAENPNNSASVVQDRRDDRDVRQVRPAAVGVVQDPRRAAGVVLAEHRRDRRRHRAEVDRDVLGLHDHLAVRVEQRGRAVVALLDVRRVRAADQDRAHLLARGAQRAGGDLQGDRVEALTRHAQDHGAGRVGRAAPARRGRRASPREGATTSGTDHIDSVDARSPTRPPGPGSTRAVRTVTSSTSASSSA